MNNQCDNCGNPYLTADWEAALKERDARIKELEKEKQILIDVFKTARDATGYSDSYFRGMYNGIEWARSCLEKDEPQYKDSIKRPTPIGAPTCAEIAEGK